MNVRRSLLRQDRAIWEGSHQVGRAQRDYSWPTDPWHFRRELVTLSSDKVTPHPEAGSVLLGHIEGHSGAEWNSWLWCCLGRTPLNQEPHSPCQRQGLSLTVTTERQSLPHPPMGGLQPGITGLTEFDHNQIKPGWRRAGWVPFLQPSSPLKLSEFPLGVQSSWTSNSKERERERETILELFLERKWSMQCQFGIFLKDSLTFLLGNVKKIKVYSIFKGFLLVTPHTDHMAWSTPIENVCFPLFWEMSRDVGVGRTFLFGPPPLSNNVATPTPPQLSGLCLYLCLEITL